MPSHNLLVIDSLKNKQDILIKEADKDGVVIMSRLKYIQEAQRQLLNTAFYKELYSQENKTKKSVEYLDIWTPF